LRQVILKIIEIFIEYIKVSPLTDPTEIEALVCKNINATEFKSAIKIGIIPEEVNKLIETYRADIAKKWVSKTENMINTIQRIAQFTKQELTLMVNEYNAYVAAEKKKNKKATPEADGLDKDTFTRILGVVLSKDPNKQKGFEAVDMQKFFDTFDSDKNGRLDFK